MTLQEPEAKTIAYYDANAKEWASAHKGIGKRPFWASEMDTFHSLLPSGRVLEIGPGAGVDAASLRALGYDYIGIDASEGLLRIAQARNPEARFRLMSVLDLDFPNESFEGFWASAVLLHIRKARSTVLRSIQRVLKAGGVGFIAMKQGEGEQEDANGRWFAYYSQIEFREILLRNGLTVIREQIRPERDTWLSYYVST